MSRRFSLCSVILYASVLSQAMAAPATQERSRQIEEALSPYVGNIKGAVTVSPKGDAYEMVIDMKPVLGHLKKSGEAFEVSVSPLKYTLTEQGGGLWDLKSEQPWEIHIASGPVVDIRLNISKLKLSGVFDEALLCFRTSMFDVSDTNYKIVQITNGKTAETRIKIQAIHGETTTQSAGPDAVDSTSNMVSTGLSEEIEVVDPNLGPIRISASSAAMTQQIMAKNIRWQPILRLYGYFLSRGVSTPLRAEEESRLRQMLGEIAPLFSHSERNNTFENVVVKSDFFEAHVAKAFIGFGMTGITEKASLGLNTQIEGMELTSKFIPEFVSGLLPGSFKADMKMGGINAAAAFKYVIDNARFHQGEQPPGFGDEVLKVLLPPGSDIKMDLNDFGLVSKLYELGATGTYAIGPSNPGSGSATIGLKGMDAIIKVMQEAPAQYNLQSGVAALVVAKGFGKADGDRVVWEIKGDKASNSLTVNGIDMTKIGGTAPATPAPQPPASP